MPGTFPRIKPTINIPLNETEKWRFGGREIGRVIAERAYIIDMVNLF